MRRALLALLLLTAACAGPERAAREGEARTGYRRTHREYDGAPPVVPHAVRALAREDCLGCHAEGMDLGADGLAPRTPHPERTLCRQCHVEQADAALLVDNRFAGARHAAHGTRAHAAAPPTLPHPRQGREACLGCHGLRGGSPIRTPHGDRVNCLQCHVEQDRAATLLTRNSFGGRP